MRRYAVASLTAAALAFAGATPAQEPVNADAKTMAGFSARVQAYAALQKRVSGTLPAAGKEATPEEIVQRERQLAAKMVSARAGARQGDLFGQEMEELIRRLLQQLFARSESRGGVRASIMDENPGRFRLAANAPYPTQVPLSTMPPEVLRNLPMLPEGLEYRFVGESLILLDPRANLVVDFVSRALPR